ncbi:polysaccharide pyruvyl transferase family protein [Kocuria palustris]|uniref:polysaccharide pyruvyl transferase family protein n=1 Tax=Kocuria palustris TaxID=71999 RepID=UPI003CE6F389
MTTVYAHITSVQAERGNLGDLMGFHIADAVLGAGSYDRLGIRSKDALPPGTVAIVGSLIAAITHAPCRVVGGGLINGNRLEYSSSFRADGVRGFLTQAVLERDANQRPEVIGDPGLLLPDLEPMPRVARRKPLGFIIHAVDREEFVRRYPEHEGDIVDNYASRAEFVHDLAQYRAIASTSLHGCIFANAYGIPVAPFVLTDQVFGGDFKFRDHYSALGIDIRRLTMDGTPDEILEAVLQTPQPTREQIDRLAQRQWSAIRAALTQT